MSRLLLLPIILATVLCGIFFLPSSGSSADSAISMTLPNTLGAWSLRKESPSQKEVDILAKDTDFSKAVCIAPIPGAYSPDGRPLGQRIDLSVVLSGTDINNSIHRPERCMPAQGHQIYDSKSTTISTPKGKTLPARELVSIQTITYGNPPTQAELHCVTYYFFVGQHMITEDHLHRTLIDMKDRIFRGQDQRWAYVSASMWFSDAGEHGLRTREDAQKEIRQFVGELADGNIDWQRINQ